MNSEQPDGGTDDLRLPSGGPRERAYTTAFSTPDRVVVEALSVPASTMSLEFFDFPPRHHGQRGGLTVDQVGYSRREWEQAIRGGQSWITRWGRILEPPLAEGYLNLDGQPGLGEALFREWMRESWPPSAHRGSTSSAADWALERPLLVAELSPPRGRPLEDAVAVAVYTAVIHQSGGDPMFLIVGASGLLAVRLLGPSMSVSGQGLAQRLQQWFDGPTEPRDDKRRRRR